MADREKVIKELHDARRYLEDKEWFDRGASPHIDALNDALAMLKEQNDCENCAIAIEDRQPVVRCKDCKWWHESKNNNGYGDCGQANGITLKSSDWFCADGKRKNY